MENNKIKISFARLNTGSFIARLKIGENNIVAATKEELREKIAKKLNCDKKGIELVEVSKMEF